MSGHSKWHSIKHKKGAADAKRGKIFTKVAAEIAVAAKDGGDPDMNFKLRLAIQKAKAVNMPSTNIDRAIARGSGTAGGPALEELTYEGYGPSGVAVMVSALTDNRNRTGADVKAAFSKYGGNLGAPGSVGYLFEQKGVVVCGPNADKEALELAAIDAGATDIDDSGEQLVVYTVPNEVEKMREALGAENVESAEVEKIASQTVHIDDEKKASSLMKMIDLLEDSDDVVEVSANYDIPDSVMEKLG
jgi:YebC/PmpR family DNA-binding regulatory protein